MKTIKWLGFVLAALSAAGEVFWTKPGQTATLHCQTKRKFKTLEWYHGGQRIVRVDGESGRQSKAQHDIAKRSTASEAILKVVSVKEEDAGRFTCKVDGHAQDHTLLVVSVWSTPSDVLVPGSTATLQCQVKGLSPGSSVKWKNPNGLETESAMIELKPVIESHAGTWECLFTEDAVTNNESLKIKVNVPPSVKAAPIPSANSPNDVPQTTCNNGVTDPPPKGTLLALSWWVWVALGVGCLIVILLIVVAIVLCKRIRRRKREHLSRRQNGHQPMQPRQFCQCNRPTAAAKPQQGRWREKPLALPRQPLLME